MENKGASPQAYTKEKEPAAECESVETQPPFSAVQNFYVLNRSARQLEKVKLCCNVDFTVNTLLAAVKRCVQPGGDDKMGVLRIEGTQATHYIVSVSGNAYGGKEEGKANDRNKKLLKLERSLQKQNTFQKCCHVARVYRFEPAVPQRALQRDDALLAEKMDNQTLEELRKRIERQAKTIAEECANLEDARKRARTWFQQSRCMHDASSPLATGASDSAVEKAGEEAMIEEKAQVILAVKNDRAYARKFAELALDSPFQRMMNYLNDLMKLNIWQTNMIAHVLVSLAEFKQSSTDTSPCDIDQLVKRSGLEYQMRHTCREFTNMEENVVLETLRVAMVLLVNGRDDRVGMLNSVMQCEENHALMRLKRLVQTDSLQMSPPPDVSWFVAHRDGSAAQLCSVCEKNFAHELAQQFDPVE